MFFATIFCAQKKLFELSSLGGDVVVLLNNKNKSKIIKQIIFYI